MRCPTSLARLLLGGLLVAWPVGAAATLIVPVSQTRTVDAYAVASGGSPSSSASYAAPDFANVNRTVSASFGDPTFNPDGSQFCCRWTSQLKQTSQIESDRLHVQADGALYYTDTVRGPVQGSARSVFDVVFDLTATSRYEFFTHEETAYVVVDQTVTLFDALGSVIPPGNGIGILEPGRYRLQVILDVPLQNISQPSSLSAEGGYQGWADLRFYAVPEPSTSLLLGLGLALLALRRRS